MDQTAPLVTIESPVASAVTSNSTMDVRGLAIDAVEAGVGAPELQVTVKNLTNDSSVAAVVSDRYFIAQDLRLEVGSNELEVKAIDSLGNFRTKSVAVSRIAVGSKRIVVISGNRQSTSARAALTQSLKVSATDSFGEPLQNFPIRFDILRGNGSISNSATAPSKPDGINLAQNLVINTNAFGIAEIWMTVGSEASPGGNSVRAWNETIAEDATFTATATRGVPVFAKVDGNNAQFVAADSAPVDALSTVILDADMNRMIAIPVRYQILSGKARFTSESAANAQVSADGQSLTVNTDKNGVAAARPVAGDEPGKVIVISGAETANNTLVGQAVFDLIVLERKSGATQFSGVVMDHTGKPLSGVRLSISRTNLVSTSDKEGKFLFSSQVPPGKIDLFVDGRNATAPANTEYPALHFETAVIQGQINQLPHPIYLPPVNRSSSQVVGGNQDVALTIPGYEGFELIVKANSVTFPDGSKVGPLVVTPVHNDRLPMVPPGGSASFGTLGWTIQPTGTRFDPPAQVKIPNPGNMQAGETAQIAQWDHDLATFVPMGRGTVSEDRTQIITDLGSGITKAGWGGCVGPDCPPTPPNCGEGGPSCRGGQCGCNECQKTLPQVPGSCGEFCIADVLKDNLSCQSNECKMCQAGSCIQRFDENASESIQAFDFKANGIQKRNLTRFSARLLAVGVFLGDKTDDYPNAQDPLTDDEKAKWELDFSAYCNANGKWRFKLKQATINVKIYLNNASNVPRRMDTGLSEVVGSNNTRCKKLNEIESRLHRSALVKSALPQSAFSCLHGAPPSGGAPPPLKWPRNDDHEGSFGTFAHEKIHRVRFKSAMNDTFAVFLSEIESLEIPIEGDADTAAEAVERLKDSSELERKIDDQIERVDLISINGNSHSNPDEFYKAKMCSFQYNSWLQTLDAKRGTLNNCAVERVLCPTVECRP